MRKGLLIFITIVFIFSIFSPFIYYTGFKYDVVYDNETNYSKSWYFYSRYHFESYNEIILDDNLYPYFFAIYYDASDSSPLINNFATLSRDLSDIFGTYIDFLDFNTIFQLPFYTSINLFCVLLPWYILSLAVIYILTFGIEFLF